MEKKDYLVGVTIIEARNLRGLDKAGTSDPYVKIYCANAPPQVTQKKFKTNAGVWNQSFTFAGVTMNQYELESFELIIEVYDYNAVFANELIGKTSIGLSTLYRNLNHEFFRIWVGLYNPDLQNYDVQGYLQLSCFIVGPNERPPAHSMEDDQNDDEEYVDEKAQAGMTEEQKLEIMKKKQGLFIIGEPSMITKGYQLSVNVLKAEGLPICTGDSCNSFISVRVSGCVQTTRVIKDNFSPIYNARMCFPVHTPLLNDKITVRLWSKTNGPDIFIANVPEYPSAFDFFNISKLMTNEGKLRATWFNLYGVPPLEKKSGQVNNGEKKEGTSFLGRVLISMQIAPNEKPQVYSAISNPTKEPDTANYLLWVDTYDLVNCDEAGGKKLWVVATMGSNKSDKHEARYRKQTDSYTWKKISVNAVQVNSPQEIHQTPDIIINVYSEKPFKGQYRVGYIRLPAKDYIGRPANPQWFRLRSPINEKTCPGIILMNVQYVWEMSAERFPKQRGVEGQFKFFAQILSGFELSPSTNQNSLCSMIDIKIGNAAMTKEPLATKALPTRYPQWNEEMEREIMIEKNLSFASDMRVLVYNASTNLFSKSKEVIGEFSVPVTSIANELYKKPQYFNVISGDGKLEGQVLARFYIREIDQKQKKNQDFSDVFREFKSITEKCLTVNIDIALFGIRNLVKNAIRPIVTFRLTHSGEKPELAKLEEKVDTRNPNFGQFVRFKNVQLPFEPLLWPMLEVTIKDDGFALGFGGCEECYTTIALFEYAREILSSDQIKFAKAQLNKNQNKLSFVQKQRNPEKILRLLADKADNAENFDLSDDSDDDGNFGVKQVGGMRIKEIDNDFEVWGQDDVNSDDEKQMRKSQIKATGSGDNAIKSDDIKLDMRNRKGKGKNNTMAEDVAADKKKVINPLELDEFNGNLGNVDGAIVDKEHIVDIACTAHLKKIENDERKQKVEEMENKIDRITLKLQETQNIERKEYLKQKLLGIKNKIQDLADEEMNEQKFWGYAMDEGNDVQYGRDVLKEGTYETLLKLPFQEFPLFSNSIGSKTAQVGGLLRSGLLTGATMKAAIKVWEEEQPEEEDSEEDSESDTDNPQEKKKDKVEIKEPQDYTTPGEPIDDAQQDEDDENMELNALKKIQLKFPFDITKERFLSSLVGVNANFKIRLYLISCQNLSAVDSNIDLKSRLAGLQALCSADPFPKIIVGDGKNDKVLQKVKFINDREKALSQNLNPKFYRSYEFDATFPEDWKIELQLYDKGRWEFTDALIGSTVIDLEDRLLGNFRKQTLDALAIYKEQAALIIKKESKKEKQDFKIIGDQRAIIDEITKHQQRLLNQIEEKPIPVEFRELRHPDKKQAQGIAEMWVEVLTPDQARKTPMARIQVSNNEDYEIRLIIWETRDVPRANGKTVDIFIKVQFDPTGWSGILIDKSTDTHYGSKDGRGVFNYRFKFDLSTPCEFPRLKFQLYDYGFINDDAIGESILNLKKTMGILAKEGRIDIPKTWLSFISPNDKYDDCGQLLISMTIIPKSEAEMAPVGEAWDEPNENPYLQKPTEGRGVGDQILAATGLDLNNLSLPNVNFFRNFIIIGIVFGVVILVLIVVMFLKP